MTTNRISTRVYAVLFTACCWTAAVALEGSPQSKMQENTSSDSLTQERVPNVVFVFIDDMGYGDIGPFGSTKNKTPNLDRMAAEGVKLTDFYVSSTACTPSRSALLTGCYADRVGMDGRVVFPGSQRGLNPSEITIAEMLKAQGYATGCFGKWHLGDMPQYMPLQQGFDEYEGIPYSNDMWVHLRDFPPLPYMKQEQAVAHIPDAPVRRCCAKRSRTRRLVSFADTATNPSLRTCRMRLCTCPGWSLQSKGNGRMVMQPRAQVEAGGRKRRPDSGRVEGTWNR